MTEVIVALPRRQRRIIERMAASGSAALYGRREFVTLDGARLGTTGDMHELVVRGLVRVIGKGIWELTSILPDDVDQSDTPERASHTHRRPILDPSASKADRRSR